MRFAIVNNERTLPATGLRGHCPSCGAEMVPKCGNERVHHWAHRGQRVCDQWWEPETEWHRTWKSQFPLPWQEIIQHDAKGEKHVADVRTGHGLTLEFQHSHLRPEERASRELFYGNMAWIVDGLRLSRDLPRFRSAQHALRQIGRGLHITPFPDEVFPRGWLDCRAPVFFDFLHAEQADEASNQLTRSLWCLLPGRANAHAVILRVAREDFIRIAHERSQLFRADVILSNVTQALQIEKARQIEQFRQAEAARLWALSKVIRRHRHRRPFSYSGRGRRF